MAGTLAAGSLNQPNSLLTVLERWYVFGSEAPGDCHFVLRNLGVVCCELLHLLDHTTLPNDVRLAARLSEATYL